MDESLTPRELGMLTVPGDVWTLILKKIHPKDAIAFVMRINRSLRKYLAEKVNWPMLLRHDFEDFVRIEKQCKAYYVINQNYPEYNKALRFTTAVSSSFPKVLRGSLHV